ncbi:malto-oligosyltrehalose synthase, partial [Streptomyces sp. 8K308]|uniref:malto-oligosyltrehalose synthase n=1 Tax=Streptomyces sp. 8K308 TaxID=2530388 RepID=UPI00140447AE
VVEGLRIDHPDGLADPGGYLARLREACGEGVWIVAEKILGPDERLPAAWPVAGTTGYDALRHVDAMFVDPEGHARLTDTYREFTGVAPEAGGAWAETVRAAGHRMIGHELAAEAARLARAAEAACLADPALLRRDHAPWALRAALVELLVRLPVYRPYVTGGEPPDPADQELLTTAAEATAGTFAVPDEATAVATVRDLALGRCEPTPPAVEFRVRFGQVSSALRAKAVEDTAGYRFAPLLSAAEVGCAPDAPGLPPDAFHAHCARVRREWPLTGTVLSTHDTKRSGDARAALASLTEHPDGWAGLVRRLTAETARAGAPAPDLHLAWTAWQTAFALGTPDRERLTAAVLKAAREAALATTWTEQDAEYERALERFVLAGPCGPPGRALAEFAHRLAPAIRANVLGAALLHLTMPGVPDVYRGSEGHYPALVDPDNRRPPVVVDGELNAEKLRLTTTALRLRRDHPDWFGPEAEHRPLTAEGPAAEHCLAFARATQAVTVVTRLPHRLAQAGGWRDTHLPLPPGDWRDLLTGGRATGKATLAELFAEAPVALLVRAPQTSGT